MTRSKAPGRLFPVNTGPLYAGHGYGAILCDADGHEYLDMICGLGAISLGYQQTPRRGPRGVYSLPHALEIEAAEAVLSDVAPWASAIRFVKTGSEATHAAYRIAKAATNRDYVLSGDWCYHGWHEWCAPAPYRFRHGGQLWGVPAAVFVEPHRWASVDVTWLQYVRAYCDRVGALLVFDEMIYGGRWALGGATEYFGVQPDLACYGKAFGNGEAVAFIVGNEALAEHGEIVSGTYSGDTSGLSAVCHVLQTYTQMPVIETLWTRGRQLAEGLEAVLAQHPDLGAVREGQPVHQRLRFPNPETGQQFAAEMARRGILVHPDVINICYAHTETQIDHVLDAATNAIKALDDAA